MAAFSELWRSGVLGIEGYEPQWCHDGRLLAAAHRDRFAPLIGQPLAGSWLMWDVDKRQWFADGPVVLGFGGTNVEITHRKFDECAITWGQIDLLTPLDWPGFALAWRGAAHPALRGVQGRVLREVNVLERVMSAHWRPRVLHAVEFRFEAARLAIYNALDENGLTGAREIDLPIGAWRRIPVA